MAADEEPQPAAKSAEDRKAASALASLDADDSPHATTLDSDAAHKAIKSLAGGPSKSSKSSSAAAKNVKVDPADVALLVQELELPKPRAAELLRSHEGDAVRAMRAYVYA